MNEIAGDSNMLSEGMSLCRWLLGATGLSTIMVGVTAPTTDIWPKMVAILGGLVATIVSVMFTTFLKHIYSHSENAEKQIDKKLEMQVRLCSADVHETIRQTIKEVLGKEVEIKTSKTGDKK